MSHASRLIPSRWVDVTPGGANSQNLIGFRVGTTAGNVTVKWDDDSTFTFKNVQVGEQIACDIKQITAATAAGIEGARN